MLVLIIGCQNRRYHCCSYCWTYHLLILSWFSLILLPCNYFFLYLKPKGTLEVRLAQSSSKVPFYWELKCSIPYQFFTFPNTCSAQLESFSFFLFFSSSFLSFFNTNYYCYYSETTTLDERINYGSQIRKTLYPRVDPKPNPIIISEI